MIYVDDHRAPYGRLVMSHMMADTEEELESMARALGLREEWRHGDHYDVSDSKRADAIVAGAKPITVIEMVKIRQSKRAEAP